MMPQGSLMELRLYCNLYGCHLPEGSEGPGTTGLTRSSSREVRIRVPVFSVYFSRGTLPTKKETVKGHLAGGPS